MSHSARIIKDSISPSGVRLTTMEVVMPRIVLAEFNTHRVFSRNSASSRAIPIEKLIKKVVNDPYIPTYWGKNQAGMQAATELSKSDQAKAKSEWLLARDSAVQHARELLEIGLHKQLVNRLLEPWLWQTVIVTATEWENFFALRTHFDAQPDLQKSAILMEHAYNTSTPKEIGYDEWHLPLVDDIDQLIRENYTLEDVIKISVGRCARVSYLTHDGVRDPKKDIELCNRLLKSGHMSPFEHVARPMHSYELGSNLGGNFRGWVQYRKKIINESNYRKVLESKVK